MIIWLKLQKRYTLAQLAQYEYFCIYACGKCILALHILPSVRLSVTWWFASIIPIRIKSEGVLEISTRFNLTSKYTSSPNSDSILQEFRSCLRLLLLPASWPSNKNIVFCIKAVGNSESNFLRAMRYLQSVALKNAWCSYLGVYSICLYAKKSLKKQIYDFFLILSDVRVQLLTCDSFLE